MRRDARRDAVNPGQRFIIQSPWFLDGSDGLFPHARKSRPPVFALVCRVDCIKGVQLDKITRDWQRFLVRAVSVRQRAATADASFRKDVAGLFFFLGIFHGPELRPALALTSSAGGHGLHTVHLA